MHYTSKKEFSLLGAFLIGLHWLLNTLTLRGIELLETTLLSPAQNAIVLCFAHCFAGPLLIIVDAVAGTHWHSTIRPRETLSRLTDSLSRTFIDWLTPSIDDTESGFNYTSCSTQTADGDFPTWTMLEFLSDGLNHLSDFFNAGLKSVSVTSPFEGNTFATLNTSNHSLVALPSTPVRKQCSPASQQKSTSPSILDCSDDDAA